MPAAQANQNTSQFEQLASALREASQQIGKVAGLLSDLANNPEKLVPEKNSATKPQQKSAVSKVYNLLGQTSAPAANGNRQPDFTGKKLTDRKNSPAAAAQNKAKKNAPVANVPQAKKTKVEESSDSSSSSATSDEEPKVPIKVQEQAKSNAQESDSSSDSSSSSDDSEDEQPSKQPVKAPVTAKKEESSDSDSSSSSSDSDDEKKPAAKSQQQSSSKPAEIKKKESSSSSSDSDSDSSSDSDDEKAPAARPVTAKKDDSSDSSSSSSDSDDDKPAPKPKVDAKPVQQEKGKKFAPNGHSKPAHKGSFTSSTPKGVQKAKNMSNSFNEKKNDSYGQKANQSLSNLKGKGFKKEMHKMKKGNYSGGKISNKSNSFKFDE